MDLAQDSDSYLNLVPSLYNSSATLLAFLRLFLSIFY